MDGQVPSPPPSGRSAATTPLVVGEAPFGTGASLITYDEVMSFATEPSWEADAASKASRMPPPL